MCQTLWQQIHHCFIGIFFVYLLLYVYPFVAHIHERFPLLHSPKKCRYQIENSLAYKWSFSQLNLFTQDRKQCGSPFRISSPNDNCCSLGVCTHHEINKMIKLYTRTKLAIVQPHYHRCDTLIFIETLISVNAFHNKWDVNNVIKEILSGVYSGSQVMIFDDYFMKWSVDRTHFSENRFDIWPLQHKTFQHSQI